MNRREFVTGLVALPALVRPASCEASTINLGKQYGLPFLPQMVMEDRKLIEAHAAKLGINGLRVGWETMGGPGALNDGLLSGNIQFVNVASASLATLWDKTFGTPQEVRAVCTALHTDHAESCGQNDCRFQRRRSHRGADREDFRPSHGTSNGGR